MRTTGRNLVGACALAATAFLAQPGGAGTVFKLTFDADGTSGGPADAKYTTGTGDVVPASMTLDRMDGKDVPATVPGIVDSNGLQGGKALKLVRPTDGSNAGYFLVNTANFYDLPADGGLTVEAVVFVDGYDPNPSSGFQGLVSQYGTGGIMPDLSLVSGTENNPAISFSLGWYGQNLKYAPPASMVGAWHHLAGVYKRNAGNDAAGAPQSSMELFVDGKSVAIQVFPVNAYQTFVPGNFGIGMNAPTAATGRILCGKLDAVALSDAPLAPEAFLLPVVAPAQ